jgi:hypothetical protein
MTSSFDMSDQSACDDPWNGGATGGMGAAPQALVSQYNVGDPAGVDLWITAAVAPSQAQGVSSGRTYAAFKLVINHQKSTGASACGGCDVPMCITLDAIRLVQPGRHGDALGNNKGTINTDLTDGIGGMGGASQVATWQGGTASCGAGLSKPSTWSELKSRFKSK